MQPRSRVYDPVPDIPAAGEMKKVADESAAQCIAPELYQPMERPITPPDLKKFRKSFRDQPGQKFIHAGLVVVDGDLSSKRFGCVTHKDIQAKQVMDGVVTTPLQEFMLEQKESHYQSRQTEPLGRTRASTISFPERYKSDEFRFGVTTVSSEPAGTVMFPKEQKDHKEQPSLEQINKKTNRHYDWNKMNIDPNTHRFGKIERNATGNGAALALDHTQATQIIPKKPAAKSFSAPSPDFTYGKASSQPDEWDAAKCITGQFTPKQQQPDADLGKSTRTLNPKFQVPQQHANRTFGVSTIRQDLPAPARRSISDATNYGDESGAADVLYSYVDDGVFNHQFAQPRSLAQIKAIFCKIDSNLTDQQYQDLAQLATQQYKVLSVDTFRKVYNQTYLNIQS